MTAPYRLHYAPDNASLVIRLALEARDLPYETALVNRATREQDGAAYRALNPGGLIPVLETSEGPIFETAAILLWLADRHGGLGPAPDAPERGTFLKWLFFASNTLHAELRMLFYPDQYTGADHADALRAGLIRRLPRHLANIERAAASPDWPGGATDFYLACLLRWMALYPTDFDRGWFGLADYPALAALCARLEAGPAARAAARAEGLGSAPFTAPRPATPPEGTAT